MDTPPSVFLVWRWKELHAICRTRDEGERLASDLVGGWDEYYGLGHDEIWVEERHLTEVPNRLDPYHVEVSRDGQVIRAEVSAYAAHWVYPPDGVRTVLVRASRFGKGRQLDRLSVQLWAETVDRAVAVAQQWRGRYIDQGRWPESKGRTK